MNEQTITAEVVHKGAVQVEHQQRATPASAYEMAMRVIADPQCDPVKLKALLDVRREWQADEARKAFNEAVVKFQQECPIIPKLDKAYDKLYSRIDRIWRTIRPLMVECGLAVTWEGYKTVDGVCILDGHLVHRDGHAQPLHHEVPLPDLLKGQNAAQRGGSGETYAKRYALCAALGIHTGDDDDGAGGAAPVIADEQVSRIRMMLKEARRTQEWLCDLADVKTIEEIPAANIGMVHKLIHKVITANEAKGAGGTGVQA